MYDLETDPAELIGAARGLRPKLENGCCKRPVNTWRKTVRARDEGMRLRAGLHELRSESWSEILRIAQILGLEWKSNDS